MIRANRREVPRVILPNPNYAPVENFHDQYQRLTLLYHLPPHANLANSEISAASIGARSLPRYNTQRYRNAVAVIQGIDQVGDVVFNQMHWTAKHLLYRLSRFLVAQREPIIIQVRPTVDPTLTYAVYCCLTFDPHNITCWHSGYSAIDHYRPRDFINVCWDAKLDAVNRLGDFGYNAAGINQVQYLALVDAHRRTEAIDFFGRFRGAQPGHAEQQDGFSQAMALIPARACNVLFNAVDHVPGTEHPLLNLHRHEVLPQFVELVPLTVRFDAFDRPSINDLPQGFTARAQFLDLQPAWLAQQRYVDNYINWLEVRMVSPQVMRNNRAVWDPKNARSRTFILDASPVAALRITEPTRGQLRRSELARIDVMNIIQALAAPPQLPRVAPVNVDVEFMPPLVHNQRRLLFDGNRQRAEEREREHVEQDLRDEFNLHQDRLEQRQQRRRELEEEEVQRIRAAAAQRQRQHLQVRIQAIVAEDDDDVQLRPGPNQMPEEQLRRRPPVVLPPQWPVRPFNLIRFPHVLQGIPPLPLLAIMPARQLIVDPDIVPPPRPYPIVEDEFFIPEDNPNQPDQPLREQPAPVPEFSSELSVFSSESSAGGTKPVNLDPPANPDSPLRRQQLIPLDEIFDALRPVLVRPRVPPVEQGNPVQPPPGPVPNNDPPVPEIQTPPEQRPPAPRYGLRERNTIAAGSGPRRLGIQGRRPGEDDLPPAVKSMDKHDRGGCGGR